MYELPDDFDPTVFVGRTLERLSFTLNTLDLAFDGDVSIRVLGEVWHCGGDDRGQWYDGATLPVRVSRLMDLLGVAVIGGEIEDRSTLVLRFANGQTVRCVEDGDHYESYHLSIGEREIIV